MASHIEIIGFVGQSTQLSKRLWERLAKLVEVLKRRDDLVASLPLDPGERVLARACDDTGDWAAASDRALYHQIGGFSGSVVAQEWARVGWEEVGDMSWRRSDCSLTFTGLVPTVARRTVLHLPTGSSLGLLAQERVASTTVVRTEIELGEYGMARVLGRRRPGSDQLTWLVGVDDGIDRVGLEVAVKAALHELRGRLGV